MIMMMMMTKLIFCFVLACSTYEGFPAATHSTFTSVSIFSFLCVLFDGSRIVDGWFIWKLQFRFCFLVWIKRTGGEERSPVLLVRTCVAVHRRSFGMRPPPSHAIGKGIQMHPKNGYGTYDKSACPPY